MNEAQKSEHEAATKCAEDIEKDLFVVGKELEDLRLAKVSAVFDKHFDNLPPKVKATAEKFLAKTNDPQEIATIKAETLASAVTFLMMRDLMSGAKKSACGDPNCLCSVEPDSKVIDSEPN